MIIKSIDECSFYPTMTIKGGASQACAACKYQRRRCSKECPLAPHFPADQPKMFQNAHRLYGVSNITKILRQLLHPEQKEEAMRSIIYESNMRAKFPVTGCMGIINQLNFQLQQAIEELRYVTTHLAICKDQCQYRIPSSPPHHSCPSSQLQLGIPSNNEAAAALTMYQHQYQYNSVASAAGMSFMANEYLANGINGIYIDDNDNMVNSLRVQHHPYYSNNNVDPMALQPNLVSSQVFPIHQEMDVPHDYDDIPFDTIADDRQSYIESKEACESSAESSFKGTTQSIEHISKNELKSAAACFSLTSVK